jgi:hypothetical protein
MMEEECKDLPEKPSVLKRCRRFLNRCHPKEKQKEKIIAVITLRSKL